MKDSSFAFRMACALALTLLLTGCVSQAPAINARPTATLNPVDLRLNDVLLSLPLRPGNTWVYSATYYDTFQTTPITATYRITETVAQAETRPPYFIAAITREKSLADLSLELDTLDPNWYLYYLDGKGETKTYWYIVSDAHVYRQEHQVDFSNVESSWLEYIFPLSENAGWYPDAEQRNLFSDINNGPTSGLRVVDAATDRQVPAGDFTNCREIRTLYLDGAIRQWFCSGIGLVSEEFNHQGTPLGHQLLLITYTLQP